MERARARMGDGVRGGDVCDWGVRRLRRGMRADEGD